MPDAICMAMLARRYIAASSAAAIALIAVLTGAQQAPWPAAQQPLPVMTKWDLWSRDTVLRGANIYQRRIYPELDKGGTGPGVMGPPYTPADFLNLSAMGANLVVISHPGIFSEKPPYGIDEQAVENLDEILERVETADMFAIIAFRTGPGRSEFAFMKGMSGIWFEEGYIDETVWKERDAQDAWVEMWEQTALRYRDSRVVVGYEVMVEPDGNAAMEAPERDPEDFYAEWGGTTYDWNTLAGRIVGAIRTADRQTPVLVSPMGSASVGWLPWLSPVPDERAVYTFHQFAPRAYTHQVPPLAIGFPSMSDLDGDGSDESFYRSWLQSLLSTADIYAMAHGVPVGVTEMGVKRWEPGADAFLSMEMDLLEARGVNHAVWMWYPSWGAWSMNGQDSFNFRHGPDPSNHVAVSPTALASAIHENWGRNDLRPSGVQFVP